MTSVMRVLSRLIETPICIQYVYKSAYSGGKGTCCQEETELLETPKPRLTTR